MLRLVFIGLVGASFGVLGVVVVARALRLTGERRRERLAAVPRRQLLGYLADGGPPEELEALVDLPAAQWRALEPAATAMLAKVRGEARDALAELFERRGIGDRALAALSRRGTGAVRRARAAEVLGSLGRRDAVPALCTQLADPEVGPVAIRALGHIGDSAAAGPLLDTLAAVDRTPVHLIAYALVQLDAGADAPLLRALDHPLARVRATVLDTLRLRGTAGAEGRAVVALGTDPDEPVRRRAAALLGRVGGRAALEPLITAATGDPDLAVREEAVQALGELGAPRAVPVLRDLLDDGAYRVAHRAGAALVQIGPAGLAALRECAHGHRASAAHAREALALAELAAPAPVRSAG